MPTSYPDIQVAEPIQTLLVVVIFTCAALLSVVLVDLFIADRWLEARARRREADLRSRLIQVKLEQLGGTAEHADRTREIEAGKRKGRGAL